MTNRVDLRQLLIDSPGKAFANVLSYDDSEPLPALSLTPKPKPVTVDPEEVVTEGNSEARVLIGVHGAVRGDPENSHQTRAAEEEPEVAADTGDAAPMQVDAGVEGEPALAEQNDEIMQDDNMET